MVIAMDVIAIALALVSVFFCFLADREIREARKNLAKLRMQLNRQYGKGTYAEQNRRH